MDFTNNSKNIIENILPYMDFYITKSNDRRRHKMVDEFAMNIFHKIRMSEATYSLYCEKGLIKREITQLKDTNILLRNHHLNSRFVPQEIKNNIVKETKTILKYTFKVGSRKIELNIGVPETMISDDNVNSRLDSHANNLIADKYETTIKIIFVWLCVLNKISTKTCSKRLNITLFLQENLKQLPYELSDILKPLHVNSGVTSTCQYKNDILIFRKEEWLKVLIHESFHALGLDFSSMKDIDLRVKLLNLFPVETTMDSSESYSEFWATMLNCAFCSYYITDRENITTQSNKNKATTYRVIKEDYLAYFDLCVAFERLFSMLQCAKVLYHMGLTYSMLHTDTPMYAAMRRLFYKEHTNVFAYYILKNILMFHYIDFIEWCSNNNRINMFRFTKTNTNLLNFYTFIEKRYNDDIFIIHLNEMFLQYDKDVKKSNKKYDIGFSYLNTMRLTLCDFE